MNTAVRLWIMCRRATPRMSARLNSRCATSFLRNWTGLWQHGEAESQFILPKIISQATF